MQPMLCHSLTFTQDTMAYFFHKEISMPLHNQDPAAKQTKMKQTK